MIDLGTLRQRYGHRRASDEPAFGWRIARLRARVRVHHARRGAENLGELAIALSLLHGPRAGLARLATALVQDAIR